MTDNGDNIADNSASTQRGPAEPESGTGRALAVIGQFIWGFFTAVVDRDLVAQSQVTVVVTPAKCRVGLTLW
jgi:hypothetical protein